MFAENDLKQTAVFGKREAETLYELDKSKKKKRVRINEREDEELDDLFQNYSKQITFFEDETVDVKANMIAQNDLKQAALFEKTKADRKSVV